MRDVLSTFQIKNMGKNFVTGGTFANFDYK